MKVLTVDDDQDVRDFLSDCVTAMGAERVESPRAEKERSHAPFRPDSTWLPWTSECRVSAESKFFL